MSTLPNNWVDEDREEVVAAIIDGIIAEMTFEQMRNKVWDMYYDDLIWQEWPDLWMQAEEYAPELVEKFQDALNKETSQ
jgi:hypothetical protein